MSRIPRIFFLLTSLLLAGNLWAQHRQPEPSVQVQSVGRQYVLVDRSTGRPASAQRYDEVRPFSGGFAVVRLGTQWGFVNARGQQVQAPAFDELSDFVEAATLARNGGTWKIIDTSGRTDRVLDAGWRPARRGTQSNPVPEPSPTRILAPHPDIPQRSDAGRTTAAGQCPFNLDFETGNFTNWRCYTGSVEDDNGVNQITVYPSAPNANQHGIVRRATPSLIDYYGRFPINPPDGSQYAIKLGNDEVGWGAERVRYVVHVPASVTDYSIRFQYAAVLENPVGSGTGTVHEDWEQPRFTAKMVDSASGEFLPCASFTYVASLVPGFQLSPISTGGLHSSPAGAPIRYKPWSSVYVNLSRFAGRTLYLDFTTADCTRGGHFGYAYVDVSECSSAAKLTYDCLPPHQTLLEGPPGFQSYQWWNQGFTQQLASSQTATLNPGPAIGAGYWVVVKPFNNTDCINCDCSDTLHAVVAPVYPQVDAGPDRVVCETGSTTFGVGAALPGNTYSWSPATNLLSPNSATTIFNGSTPGTYVLTVTDANNCSSKDTVEVAIQPRPVPGFTVTNSARCAGDRFSFANSSSVAAGTLSYSWDFGDNSSSTDPTPTHTYANPGTYSVKLVTTTGAGCKDSLTVPVTVYHKPVPAFTLNAQGQCLTNNLFQFTNGSSVVGGTFTGAWNFGDGSSSADVSPSHSYAAPGAYTVTLVLTSDQGCIDSVRNVMTVDAPPTAAFSINNAAQCLNGNAFQLTSNASIPAGTFTTVYDLGDANTIALPNPAHIYNLPGTYTIVQTVTTPNGCASSVSHPVTVHPKPNIDFSINNPGQCLRGNQFQFGSNATVSPGSISISWNLGDNTQATQSNVTHSYAAPGTYMVQLLALSNQGCKDSLQQPVTVHPMPQPAFAINNAAQCLNGNSFVSTNGSTVATGTMSYQWSYSDGAASGQVSPAYSFATHGAFSIGLVVTTDKGCIDSTRKPVTVHPKPMPAFMPNTVQQCLRGNNYQFTSGATIAGGSFTQQWYFGDGASSQLLNPAHAYAAAGLYIVRQVLTSDKGCKDSTDAQVDVVVNPQVQTGVTPRTQILCEGDSLQLNAVGAVQYSWSPANALSCSNCPSPRAAPRSDQTYYLTGFGPTGCPGADTVFVSVRHPFHISAQGLVLCSGVPGQLSAQGASSYSWTPATGLSLPSGPNPTVVLDSSVQYQLVGYDSVHCFTDTIHVLVHINLSPRVDAGPDLSLPTGATQQIVPAVTNGPIVSWTWFPATDLSCANCPDPTIRVRQDAWYVVKVVNNFGCKSTDTLRIGTFCKDAQVFVANAFTPNGDGVNDVLFPQASGIAKVKYFRVFNRWGELLFERTEFQPNDARYGWDGKIRGVLAPPDVFTWTAQVVCENKTEYTLKGNVSVLK